MFTFSITDQGYDIYLNDVLLISQASVPGVQGTVPFTDDADKTAHAKAQIATLTPSTQAAQ